MRQSSSISTGATVEPVAVIGAAAHCAAAKPFDLGTLPLALWRMHLWPLLDGQDRGALRGSCKAARVLCEQLIDSLALEVEGECADESCNLARAFAARLAPQLESLTIRSNDYPLEPWIAAAASAAGAAKSPFAAATQLSVQCSNPAHAAASCNALASLLEQLPRLRCASIALPGPPPADLADGLVACCPDLQALSIDMRGAALHYDMLSTFLEPSLHALSDLWRLTSLSCAFQLEAGRVESGGRAPRDLVAHPDAACAVRCLGSAASLTPLRQLAWHAPWTWAGIAPLARLKHLTSLELTTLPLDPDPEHLPPAAVAACQGLTVLNLGHVKLDTNVWVALLAKLPCLQRVAATVGRLTGPLPPLERLTHLRYNGGEFNDAADVTNVMQALPRLRCLEARLDVTLPGSYADAPGMLEAQEADLAQYLLLVNMFNLPNMPVVQLPAAPVTLAAHWGRLVALDLALQRLAGACHVGLELSVQEPALLEAYMAAAAADAQHPACHRFSCIGRPYTFISAGQQQGSGALLQLLCQTFATAERVSLVGANLEWVVGGAAAWLPQLVQPWRREVWLQLCTGLGLETVRELARALARACSDEPAAVRVRHYQESLPAELNGSLPAELKEWHGRVLLAVSGS